MSNLRRPRWGRTVAFTIVLVSLTAVLALPANAIPPPGDDPGPPGPPPCLENTKVNSMSVNRKSTLGGGLDKVRFSWNIKKGCSNLDLRVEGQSVPAVGSMDVSVPTSRKLTVRGQIIGCCSATWYGPYVVAGRFIRYPVRLNGTLGVGQAHGSSGSATTDSAARKVLESMRPAYSNHFAGKRIEIHIAPQAPQAFRIGDLPPWDENPPSGDPAGIGAAYSEGSYVDEHGRWGPGPDVHTIGIKEGHGSSVVTHELGHAVLFHAGDAINNEALLAFVTHGWCPGGEGCNPNAPAPKWVGCAGGDDDYGATNVHEYWAEGTAALFEAAGICTSFLPPFPDQNQYTRQYLAATDPLLNQVLRKVFAVPQ